MLFYTTAVHNDLISLQATNALVLQLVKMAQLRSISLKLSPSHIQICALLAFNNNAIRNLWDGLNLLTKCLCQYEV